LTEIQVKIELYLKALMSNRGGVITRGQVRDNPGLIHEVNYFDPFALNNEIPRENEGNRSDQIQPPVNSVADNTKQWSSIAT
jgi:hypothetical protein